MASTSPARSIPARNLLQHFSTTLLRFIFEHVGANEPVLLPLQRSDPRYILSLVCRRWVEIIRSTPSFWDHIRFTRPRYTLGPNPLLYQLSICTTRSRQNPLSIVFDMVCNGWSFSIVRRVIIPHLHRIEALSCPVYGNPDIIEFLTIDGAQFTILKFVTIWFINTRSNPLSSFPPDVCIRFCGLRNAPHLRKVDVRLTNGLDPTALHLPWDHLTTMDFGKIAMSPEEFITIFHFTALQLEDAFFYVKFSNLLHMNNTLWKDVVTMHALKTLRLKLLFPSADTRLFSHLRFPVLKYAWIQMHDHFQDWDTPLYTELFRASTKSLQILHLSDYLPRGNAVHGFAIRRRHRETTHGSLERLFEVISNVRYLHLPLGLHIHTVSLEKMASYVLLPQLRNLDLGTINAWPVLLMARQRRAHFLNPQGTSRSLKTAVPKSTEESQPLGSLNYINIMVPRHGHGFRAQDHAALIAEARVLGLLGIGCRIQGTNILPLPMMKSVQMVPQVHFPPSNLNALV